MLNPAGVSPASGAKAVTEQSKAVKFPEAQTFDLRV